MTSIVETDVVVVGSGAAGLAAAIAASDHGALVTLIEKASSIGGTTGVSGGIVWVPLNEHMAEAGVEDNREDALRYIRRITLGREPDPALIEVYVDQARVVLAHLEAHTPLRVMASSVFSDYYADFDGGRTSARSVEPLPFRADVLGEWADKVRQSPFMAPFTGEESAGSVPDRIIDSNPLTTAMPRQTALTELAEQRRRDDIRVRGSSLVGALLAGLLDRGIVPLLDTAADRLLVNHEGVVGVGCTTQSGTVEIMARQGVVLASGGFEWNRDMVRAFIGHELDPLSPPYNHGDGHRMAMAVGAQMANMSSYWGQPGMIDPAIEYEGRPVLQFVSGRGLPGSILVNRGGRRFVNEGISYQDIVGAFREFDPVAMEYPNQAPVWMVFDHRMKSTYQLLSIAPDAEVPEWVITDPSIEGLAAKLGLPPAALRATVDRFNRHASAGHDPDFARGTVWFEGFMSGGPSAHRCLGPLAEPPYHAIAVHHGTIGTNGGPRIDPHGRVLDYSSLPIRGLYAAGNLSACVFGPAYPGGGATIGPALTFGFLAGQHAAGEVRRWPESAT
jgi:succinate dehydrogenase/fumarate reductase flavoprotein subunit